MGIHIVLDDEELIHSEADSWRVTDQGYLQVFIGFDLAGEVAPGRWVYVLNIKDEDSTWTEDDE